MFYDKEALHRQGEDGDHQEVQDIGLDPYRYFEYALENVGRRPIEAIFPYSKDLEIRSTKTGFDRQAQNVPFKTPGCQSATFAEKCHHF